MNKILTISALASLALTACNKEKSVIPGGADAAGDGDGGAADGGVVDDSGPAAEAPEIPEGVTLEGPGPVFKVDRATATFEIPVADSTSVLQGVLADDKGRRELRWVDPATGEHEVLAEAGWNLPPAAKPAHDSVMACFNSLPGEPSALSDGDLPDPTQGVHLQCRRRTADGWSNPVRVGAHFKAAWLQEVLATDAGWDVRFYADDGWFGAPARPGHGTYSQLYDAADGWADAVLVAPAGDLEEVPMESIE